MNLIFSYVVQDDALEQISQMDDQRSNSNLLIFSIVCFYAFSPGAPTTKKSVSIEQRLNSSPPTQSESVGSCKKKGGGPCAFVTPVLVFFSSAARPDVNAFVISNN